MKLSFKKILLLLFALVAIIFEGYFGVITLVGFFIQSILVAFAFYLLVWIFRPKQLPLLKKAIPRYFIVTIGIVGMILSVPLGFIAYHNLIPAVVSDISLTNSRGQQVVFLEMSHIATPEFFAQKREKIRSFTESGYVVIVEGVGTGSVESQRAFDTQMGFNFTPTLYDEMASLIGFVSQDRSLYDSVSTGALVSVDISLDEIVALAGTGGLETATSPINLESELQKIRDTVTPQERQFVAWVARAFLNWSLKRSANVSSTIEAGGKKNIFDVIVHRRNDCIVDYILKNPTKNIVIVYGALHFNGVYEGLQRSDTTWRTTHIDSRTPYR